MKKFIIILSLVLLTACSKKETIVDVPFKDDEAFELSYVNTEVFKTVDLSLDNIEDYFYFIIDCKRQNDYYDENHVNIIGQEYTKTIDAALNGNIVVIEHRDVAFKIHYWGTKTIRRTKEEFAVDESSDYIEYDFNKDSTPILLTYSYIEYNNGENDLEKIYLDGFELEDIQGTLTTFDRSNIHFEIGDDYREYLCIKNGDKKFFICRDLSMYDLYDGNQKIIKTFDFFEDALLAACDLLAS